ncbi:hypothetical protein ACLOJK_040803 [Asimina triloba]
MARRRDKAWAAVGWREDGGAGRTKTDDEGRPLLPQNPSLTAMMRAGSDGGPILHDDGNLSRFGRQTAKRLHPLRRRGWLDPASASQAAGPADGKSGGTMGDGDDPAGWGGKRHRRRAHPTHQQQVGPHQSSPNQRAARGSRH